MVRLRACATSQIPAMRGCSRHSSTRPTTAVRPRYISAWWASSHQTRDCSERFSKLSTRSIKRKSDLQIQPDGCRLAISKPGGQGYGEPIIHISCSGIYLIKDRRNAITTLRFKCQPGYEIEPVFESENWTRIKKQVACFRSGCLAERL